MGTHWPCSLEAVLQCMRFVVRSSYTIVKNHRTHRSASKFSAPNVDDETMLLSQRHDRWFTSIFLNVTISQSYYKALTLCKFLCKHCTWCHSLCFFYVNTEEKPEKCMVWNSMNFILVGTSYCEVRRKSIDEQCVEYHGSECEHAGDDA